ncbi:MAG: ChaN family lipoprotein [Planctomycetota bacterium]
MYKKVRRFLSSPVLFIALFSGIMPSSCKAFESVQKGLDVAAPAGSPMVMLQDGMIAYPTNMRRVTPDGAWEDLSNLGLSALDSGPGSPGTWLYTGATKQGTVSTIITLGASTSLHKTNSSALLEIQADTHPMDIRPSKEAMVSQARFGFTVLLNGNPVETPVSYRAGRFGKSLDETSEDANNHETIMGKGRVYIDEPGLWWITAEQTQPDGNPFLASLTFTIPERPGPDQYAAFTQKGEYLQSLDSMVEQLADAEVIFIGENHNDPVAHHLELELLAAIHQAKKRVALSMEMFERDVQPVLDGYLAGLFTERHFLSASRPWPKYATDYRPMVEYSKKHDLPVLAANAPRRIVNLVTRKGPEALSLLPEEELKWIPSLDYHIPTEGRYVEKLANLFSGMTEPEGEEEPGLPGPRIKRDWRIKGCPELSLYNELLVNESNDSMKESGKMPPAGMMMHAQQSKGNPSQSLWDATMAHTIASFMEREPGTTVVQVNGSFHSNEGLGTVEQLLRYRPETKIAVISILPDSTFPAFDKESLGCLGDIVIVTDPQWQPEE